MRYSIILATVDREVEVCHYLRSLSAQTCRDFQLIVVDQNSDDRVTRVLDRFRERFPVRRVRSDRGHSRAMNVGLSQATGDIVAFPDDDCWYNPDLLTRVANALEAHPEASGVTGRENVEPGLKSGNWDARPGNITIANIWRRAISFSIFLRREVAARYQFDESLGVGAETPWGAGEETDYLLRLMRDGHSFYYDPAISVWHQGHSGPYTQATFAKARRYGMGVGRVLRKNNYPLSLAASHMVRPAGGAALALLSGNLNRARYHWSILAGRTHGWFQGPHSPPEAVSATLISSKEV